MRSNQLSYLAIALKASAKIDIISILANFLATFCNFAGTLGNSRGPPGGLFSGSLGLHRAMICGQSRQPNVAAGRREAARPRSGSVADAARACACACAYIHPCTPAYRSAHKRFWLLLLFIMVCGAVCGGVCCALCRRYPITA